MCRWRHERRPDGRRAQLGDERAEHALPDGPVHPASASAGEATCVRWPPKKTRPRAPLAIAWYAMKRSSWRLGKRGTTAGCAFEGAVPLQAIWSVVHTGLPPAAATILRVTSPTTLRS